MPDIGLIELIFIGIVGFLVLGPERLPEFFSQIAGFVRKGREWMSNLKQQIALEKKQLKEPIDEAKSALIEGVNVSEDEAGTGQKNADEKSV